MGLGPRAFVPVCIFLLVACTGACVAKEATVDNGILTGKGAATDAAFREREEEAINANGPSIKERKMRQHAQRFEFQAEVNRLMDIIINSLYSNKDIFLRELISNASDALDKIRFLSLTDKAQLGEGDTAKLDIKISIDKQRKALIIRDRGIGMTKDDLIKNLGTIAKSGTSAFLEQMQKGGDVNLIGQFGVGFYSVYLVADYVEVVTKHNDDTQYIWESSADGNFAISEDTDGTPLGRGTELRIFLKEECQEYLDEAKLQELVGKYSEFINFPIYLWVSSEVEREEVPTPTDADKDADADDADKDDTADVDDDVEDDEAEDAPAPAPEKVKETVWDWKLLNENKAIWLRPPSEITEEEYTNFYKAVGKAYDEPLARVHFRGEGDVEFTAVLYLPKMAPFDMYDSYYSRKAQVKLYVRRVFITDEMEDFLPKYLSFLVGLVDSDSLPLNVSREMLQQHASLKTIKKKIVRKALDMIKRLADAEKAKRTAPDDLDQDTKELAEKYTTFWKEFGKALKLGIIEDATNRNRLAKLMRFHTSKSGEALTDLEEYIGRMKEGQKHIYFLTGASKEELAASPFLEQLTAQDYEVIYFTDPLDEYMMNSLKEYDDREFANASKEDLKIGKKDKTKLKAMKEAFKDFTKWWADAIGDKNVDVKLSQRLSTTPCIVVTSKYGWSANMERIMRAQALGDSEKQSYMKAKRFLEINPRHAMVSKLKELHDANADSQVAKDLAKVLYETALLESGFGIEDVKGFNGRVRQLLQEKMGASDEVAADDDEVVVGEDAADEEVHDEL